MKIGGGNQSREGGVAQGCVMEGATPAKVCLLVLQPLESYMK